MKIFDLTMLSVFIFGILRNGKADLKAVMTWCSIPMSVMVVVYVPSSGVVIVLVNRVFSTSSS